MSDYAQRYLDALLATVKKDAPFESATVLGEISSPKAKQPHIAVYVRLGESRCVGTTAGLSERPMPLPVKAGFQYFELCAQTTKHDPRILWLLSNLGTHMLATSSPFFYGAGMDPQTGAVPEAKPFLPHESLMLGGDGTRFLFVPRWRFAVPMGPPVEVVEPLPITPEQWQSLGPMSLDERGQWAKSLGARSEAQWEPLLRASR